MPPAVAGALAAELRIGAGEPVLDLAAGTGKLTRALLAIGLDVIAVEPQDAMREILAEHVGAERVRDGTAEQIPLADQEVAAVTVADSFHWFDGAAAAREIRRVLRRPGGLAVMSSVPDWSGAQWGHDLGSLIADLRPEHPHYDGPPWQEHFHREDGWSEPREIQLRVPRATSVEQILDLLESISWIAALDPDERLKTRQKAESIITSGEMPSELATQVTIGLTTLA